MDIDHSGPRLRRLLLLFSLPLPPHLFILLFYGSFFSSSFLPPPCLQPFHFKSLSIFTPYPPPLMVQSAAYMDVASLHRLYLRPAPRVCIFCRSHSGSLPHFPPSACTHVPVGPWGVRPLRVPLLHTLVCMRLSIWTFTRQN